MKYLLTAAYLFTFSSLALTAIIHEHVRDHLGVYLAGILAGIGVGIWIALTTIYDGWR